MTSRVRVGDLGLGTWGWVSNCGRSHRRPSVPLFNSFVGAGLLSKDGQAPRPASSASLTSKRRSMFRSASQGCVRRRSGTDQSLPSSTSDHSIPRTHPVHPNKAPALSLGFFNESSREEIQTPDFEFAIGPHAKRSCQRGGQKLELRLGRSPLGKGDVTVDSTCPRQLRSLATRATKSDLLESYKSRPRQCQACNSVPAFH